MDDFDVNTTYIATHERLGEQFLVKYDECINSISMDDFLKRETQYEEDETFEINLGNDFVVGESSRELGFNTNTAMSIYKQQCEEKAGDIIADADMDDMAEYSCCFCSVEMMKTQWHKCSECGNNVHGYGIGCMDMEGVCKNCNPVVNT